MCTRNYSPIEWFIKFEEVKELLGRGIIHRRRFIAPAKEKIRKYSLFQHSLSPRDSSLVWGGRTYRHLLTSTTTDFLTATPPNHKMISVLLALTLALTFSLYADSWVALTLTLFVPRDHPFILPAVLCPVQTTPRGSCRQTLDSVLLSPRLMFGKTEN